MSVGAGEARQVVFGPLDMVSEEDFEVFFLNETFSLNPTFAFGTRFVMVVRNDHLGTGPLESLHFRVNGRLVDVELAPDEVLELPVALELAPLDNVLDGTARGTEGHAAQLAFVVREPVVQAGTLRLAGARANATITTLLSLAGAGRGRVGFRVVLLDEAGSEVGTTSARVLAPGASETVDLATVVERLGLSWPGGSVAVRWVGDVGARLVGHAVEALTGDVDGGRLEPDRSPTAGPFPLVEVEITPVPPSEVTEFLEPV